MSDFNVSPIGAKTMNTTTLFLVASAAPNARTPEMFPNYHLAEMQSALWNHKYPGEMYVVVEVELPVTLEKVA